MRLSGKAMVLAVALLLTGCGAAPTPLPEALSAVPTGLPEQASPEPTFTQVAVLPSSTARTLPRGTEIHKPPPTQTTPVTDAPGPVRVTIVYDNTAAQPGLGAEWGFAAWIEVGQWQILFDTGPDGPTLLGNLAQLGFDPEEIDAVVLSHQHGDHTGGLAMLLGTGIRPPIYVPRGFSEALKASLRARTELIEVLDPVEILPGMHSTGQLGGGPVEQALVLESRSGLIVLTGCAHPGIVRIIRQARDLVEGEIALVLGGFHLVETPRERVDGIIDTFLEMGVRQVAPTHCTGESATARFCAKYGSDCLAGGAGQVFVIGQEQGGASAPASTIVPTRGSVPSPEPAATTRPTNEPGTVDKYQKPGNYIDTVRIAGISRWFTVHLPPDYRPGVPMPLVLNLHAFGSTAYQQEALTQMHAKADEAGFIAVHPQALNEPPAWYGPKPGADGQNDRDFFQALLIYLAQVISVDPDRIYATGLSNGGTMSYRLGCDMAGTFAAIAPVAGGHLNHHLCQPDEPISVLVIHGSDDPVIPYLGQGEDQPPVPVWAEAWAGHNGCSALPKENHLYESVRAETWTGCDGGAEVILYTLEGGGHTWPGAPLALSGGTSFLYMNATDAIWEFFAAHPKASQR